MISQQRTYTVYKSFIHKMVAKKAGMDRERNYVTVALFMSALAPSGGAYSAPTDLRYRPFFLNLRYFGLQTVKLP